MTMQYLAKLPGILHVHHWHNYAYGYQSIQIYSLGSMGTLHFIWINISDHAM